MSTEKPETPPGYSHVPAGHIASVVTCLEMTAKPALVSTNFPDTIKLQPMIRPQIDVYKTLYRKIGASWLWFSRLIMSDEQLESILGNDHVEIYLLKDQDEDIGLLELDFREPGQCEVVFLGLSDDSTGRGLGRTLMNSAIETAWSRNINRLWLHTCTLDHPSALAFYIRSGFRPYAFQVENQPDPRLTGHLSPDVAPHVPLIHPDIGASV